MAGGNTNQPSSNFVEIENDDNESTKDDFVNARVDPVGNHPNMIKSSPLESSHVEYP